MCVAAGNARPKGNADGLRFVGSQRDVALAAWQFKGGAGRHCHAHNGRQRPGVSQHYWQRCCASLCAGQSRLALLLSAHMQPTLCLPRSYRCWSGARSASQHVCGQGSLHRDGWKAMLQGTSTCNRRQRTRALPEQPSESLTQVRHMLLGAPLLRLVALPRPEPI